MNFVFKEKSFPAIKCNNFFGLFLEYFAAKAQSDCTGVPDGTVIDWGCRSYTICEDEQPVIIDCSENGQVYNPDIMACDEYMHTFK